MSDLELRWADEAVVVDAARPVTRADCIDGPRPCMWTFCRHNIATASERCVLDVVAAEPRGLGLREVAALIHRSTERTRQIEEIGLAKLRKRLDPDMLEGLTAAPETAYQETLADIIDADFKAAVDRAYERIVPEGERGAKAIRVAKNGGAR